MKKFLSLVTAAFACISMTAAPTVPTGTLNPANVPSEGWAGKATPTHVENGDWVCFLPYEIYQSTGLDWAATDKGGSSGTSWSAMDPIPASTAWSGDVKAATMREDNGGGNQKGPYYYRVTNCTGVKALVKSGSNGKRTASLEAYLLTNGVPAETPVQSVTMEKNENDLLSLSNLNNTAEYLIVVKQIVGGTAGTSEGNSTYYVIAFETVATTDPILNVSPAELTLAATAAQPMATATVTFSGKNLAAGTYSLTVPNTAGLSVSPQSVTVGADGKLETAVTLTYAPSSDASGSTTLSLTIGELTKSVTVNYSASFVKEYMSSINIEQLVLDYGVNYDIKTALASKNIEFSNINALDSLNDEKTNRNEPYLGLKLKKTGAYVAGWLKAGSTIRVKFGYVAEKVNVSVNSSTQVLEPADHKLDILEMTAQEDSYLKLQTTTDATVVLKQIMIDEPIADVDLPGVPTPEPVPVTGVELNKSELTLETGATETLTATVKPTNADNKNITWTSSNEAVAGVVNGLVTALAVGETTVTVKTEDGGYTAACTVTVTEPAPPVAVTGVSLNKKQLTLSVGRTETLTATVEPAEAANKNITWGSNMESVATVADGLVTAVAVGEAAVFVITEDGQFTDTCLVTVSEPEPLSSNADLQELIVLSSSDAGVQYALTPAFAADVYNYAVELPEGSGKPVVQATPADAKATVVIDPQPSDPLPIPGTVTITVTAEDQQTVKVYTIAFTQVVPVPQTDLSLHLPEVYEAQTIFGGYGGTLSIFEGREYEVYYATFDNDSHYQVAVTPVQKTNGITETTDNNYSCRAKDGWLDVVGSTSKSNYTMTATDEFKGGESGTHKIYNNGYYKMHVKGYDRFSFYGKDNSTTIDPNNESKNKRFQVYIDNVLQPETQVSTDETIRRYEITTGEHVIEVRGIGASNNYFYGFSLRLAQEPRVKWLYGNDTTQRVRATDRLEPVRYFTKYNALGETRLLWDGEAVDGITLDSLNSSDLGDTLLLNGNANCKAGVYAYHVASYLNGVETSRCSGSFKVYNAIRALTETDVDAYQNEAIDVIQFRYYTFDETDVRFTWDSLPGPNGVTATAKDGIFTISGTPVDTGTYSYHIAVVDGDTIFGKLHVRELDLGNNPILYLYKHSGAYDRDSVYSLMTRKGYNLIARKAKMDGLRPAEQYTNYKWVLISEDADASSEEVLSVARGGANLPVLNMQAFTYVYERNAETPEGWGEPDNGSISPEGRFITVQRDDHPIFRALGAKRGERIQVLDTISQKGLMPINVYQQGTLCLATSLTRGDEYYNDGEMQTFLHEIPANMRGGQRYICMPLSISGGTNLTRQGEQLVEAVVQYLTGSEPGISRPVLQIERFYIGDIRGDINQSENTIHFEIDRAIYPEDQLDLSRVVTDITLSSNYSFTTPAATDTVDLSWSYFTPVSYVVSDYINRRMYNVTVHTFNSEGIEQVYTVGEWVNIYDLFGRKVAVTNENIHTLTLPRGVYIVVTETGQTLKIAR